MKHRLRWLTSLAYFTISIAIGPYVGQGLIEMQEIGAPPLAFVILSLTLSICVMLFIAGIRMVWDCAGARQPRDTGYGRAIYPSS